MLAPIVSTPSRSRGSPAVFALVLLMLASGCGGGGGGGNNNAPPAAVASPPPPAVAQPHSQCSLAVAKREVLSLFRDYYLFNDDVTYPGQTTKYATIEANLSSYPTVDALLDDLRYESGRYDRGFSFYATTEAVEQFYSAGEFVGFGFSLGIGTGNVWRVIDVYANSPAADAGWQRGDTILAVNGVATSGLDPNDSSVLGPAESGVSREFRIRFSGGAEAVVALTKRTVDLDPVPADRVQVFDVAGRRVGYVYFRTFVEDADAALRAAIGDLAAQGVDDLVIDVRYNGGGLVSTAEVLGGLLVGPGRAGQLFYEYLFNPQLSAAYDEPRFFPLEADGFDALQNLYFLTDSGSASASELTLSGVSPYVSTRSIGARTYGKPVGQWGLEYCNDSMVLFVVTFRSLNSVGEGDYFDGIAPDCGAPDDWNHLLGDPAEARLAATLDYIESNGAACAAVATTASASLQGGARFETRPVETGSTLAARWLRSY